MSLSEQVGNESGSDNADSPRLPNTRSVFKPHWAEIALPAIAASIAATGIAAWTLFSNFRARFGPIDDHEPLRWLRGAARLPPSEYFSTLFGQTEVGNFGESTRFRPAYYTIRVATTVIAGDSPTVWYGISFAAFVATVGLLGYVASIWLSAAMRAQLTDKGLIAVSLYAFITTAFFAAMPSWAGIVTRLGPSELWALLGVALTALALTQLARGGAQLWWILALLGTSLAVLSKENFAPLSLVTLAVGVYRSFLPGQDGTNSLLGGLGLLPLALLLGGLGPQIAINQRDVYNNAIEPSRAASALEALASTYLTYWLPVYLLLLAATILLFLTKSKPCRRTAVLIASIIAIVFTWLILDSFLYSGEYLLPRYWAVFEILKTIALVAALPVSVAVIRRSTGPLRVFSYLTAATAVLAIAFISSSIPQQLHALKVASAFNATATTRYQSEVQHAVGLASGQDRPAFLLVAKANVDYEPIFALSLAVLQANPRARVYVQVPDGVSAPAIDGLSQDGSRARGLLPLGDLSKGGADICIFINSDPAPVQNCSESLVARINAQAM